MDPRSPKPPDSKLVSKLVDDCERMLVQEDLDELNALWKGCYGMWPGEGWYDPANN